MIIEAPCANVHRIRSCVYRYLIAIRIKRELHTVKNRIGYKLILAVGSVTIVIITVFAYFIVNSQQEALIAQVEHNLGLAESFFDRWPDLFTWRRPSAGSTALVGMAVPSVMAFATKLAEEAGVLILPAVTLGSDDHHMRMGFGRVGFGVALEKFEAYLASQYFD